MKNEESRSLRLWWALTAEEPFRALMPLGVLAVILGGLVWPLSMWGIWWAPVAPVEVHWRLMLEGFVGLFAIGFLGTAGPRLLSVPCLGRTEANVIMSAAVLQLILTALGWIALADLTFLLLFGAFLTMLMVRWPLRGDWPPPGLVLVLGGSLGTLSAVGLILLGHWAPMPAALITFSRAWIAELWPLLLILGVGPYFFPRYAGVESRHDLPEGRARPEPWKALALESCAIGLVAVAGLLVEHFASNVRMGLGLRLLAMSWFLLREFPVNLWIRVRGGAGLAVVTGLAGICASLAFRMGWPSSGMPGSHLLYLCGFAMVVFGVATRVLLGHSGQGEQLRNLAPASVLLIIGITVAAALRMVVLWAPEATMWAYHGGGFALAVAVLIWALRFLPAVVRPDGD